MQTSPTTKPSTRVLLASLVVAMVAVAVVVGGVVTAQSSLATTIRAGRVEQHLCRPEPPDYPGCTPAQVRPLLRVRFAREYTGHAAGYRYHRMGQHHRGVIFVHVPPPLNAKLGRLYRAAVHRYAEHHGQRIVGPDGQVRVVSAYPRYRTWAGFRRQATSFCNGNLINRHFPTQYCWAITKLGDAGALIRTLLRDTQRIAFSCNGYAIGGWASGTFAAWKVGTGLLAGGYYGAVGVEIGCQTTNLWNWATHLW